MKKIHHSVRQFIFSFIDIFHAPVKKYIPLQTFRYAACGGGNVVFDIVLFALSYNFVFMKQNVDLGFYTLSPHVAAQIFSFSASFCTGFYLNRYIVFQQSGLTRRGQLLRWVLVNAVSLLLNFIFIKLLVEYFGWYPTPSKILTTAIVICFSYFIQTQIFFRDRTTA